MCSCQPLLSSTRNSQAAHVRLFEMTGCSKLCYSAEKQQNADEICAAASHVVSMGIPSFADMVAQESRPYPFTGTIEDVQNKVAFIAHSSGTTGTHLEMSTIRHSSSNTIYYSRLPQTNPTYIWVLWSVGPWSPCPYPTRPCCWSSRPVDTG